MKKALKISVFIMPAVLLCMICPATRTQEAGDFEAKVDKLIGELGGAATAPVFYVAFYEGADREVVKEIVPMIREQMFNVPVVLLDGEITVPEDAYVEVRKQYYTGRMQELLAGNMPENSAGYIAITDKDIYVGRRPNVRGSANPELGVAVVSTFRIKPEASEYRYKLRMLKEILHEMGHLMGLEHCESEMYCIMGFSLDLSALDAKYRVFCPFHKLQIEKYLKGRGINLEKYKLPGREGAAVGGGN